MRRTIRGKMILFIGLPAAVVFVTALLWILSFAEKQARRIREAEMAEHAASYAARFDEYFGKAARVADTTARFTSVVPDLKERQIFGLLRGTVRINRRIYGAAMAFEPGTFKEDDSLFCPYVHEKRDGKGYVEMNIDEYDWYRDEQWQWWHLPKEVGKGVWTDPYFDEGAGNILMTTYAVPFKRHGEFSGVTTVDIDLERLREDSGETFSGVGDFYIIGSKGRIISSPDAAEILGETIFEKLEKKGRSDLVEVMRKVLSGPSGEQTLDALFVDGEPVIMAYAPIPSPGWTFLSVIPEHEALADFHQHRAYVVSGFLGAGALMLLTIIFMSGKVSGPIRKLRGQVVRVAEGESGIEIADTGSGDEISELAKAFANMQEKVTDREVKLENARETTLTELLESAPDAMIVANAEGRICRMNTKMAEIFGYDREELEAMTVEELMPKQFREGHGQHMKAYFANPKARQMGAALELLGCRKDGSEFPIEIGLSPFHEPSGVMGVAAIRDITKRKKQEAELRKLNQAIEQGSTMVFITNTDGDIEYVNPRFTEVTGYSPEEAIGQSPRLLKSGLQEPTLYADVWETLSNGQEWRGEFCNRRKDGSLFWASAALAPIRDADGEITHFVAIEDDITDEKDAAEEIKKKEKRFRTLLANLPGTVYRCANAEEWTIQFISERVEEFTGYPAADFTSNQVRWFKSVVHPDDRQKVSDEVGKAVEAHEPWTIQYRIIHQDKGERWAGERGRAIYRENGEVDYLDGVIIDITREKGLEAEAKLAREQADAANHAKSDFLSSMSHELRTPLNGVLGYAQILQRDKSATPKQRDNVESIISCGDHLLSLINDVLDLSKIEAGRLELDEGPCDLSKLVRSITDIISQRAQSKQLDFVVDVSAEVPRGIITDSAKLRQILVNLLGNAVKFTAEGSVTLRIRESDDHRLALEVIDTGVGLDEHEVEEIFDPFKQVEAGKAAGGTGLGLAISRKLLEKMGGVIEVDSEKGKGSCFRILLPLVEAEEGELDAMDFNAGSGSASVTLAAGQSFRILVTDDSEANRDILEQLLQEAGFEVVLADDGDTALEALRESAFDLVLMDVRMPRLNGIDAVKQIREDDELKSIPVIAVTASVFPEFRDKALAVGFNDFLPKPFRAGELMDKLRQQLDLTWETPAQEQDTETPEQAAGDGGSDSAGDADATALQVVPEEALEKFRAALKIKNLTALKTLAAELAENPQTAATGAEIGRLAQGFDFAGLAKLEQELSARTSS